MADPAELRSWLDEALKRNDRTYAALEKIEENLPEGPEGEVHNLWADVEDHQQTVRRLLIRMRDRVRKDSGNG